MNYYYIFTINNIRMYTKISVYIFLLYNNLRIVKNAYHTFNKSEHATLVHQKNL